MKKRIVITGMGIASPLGLTVEENWKNLLSGVSGVGKISLYDTSKETTQFAAEVKNFNPEMAMDTRDIRRCDRFIHFGMYAGNQAIEMAGLNREKNRIDLNRVGINMGSGIGGLSMIQENHIKGIEGGPRKISPFFIAGSIINMIGGYLSIRHGFKGPSLAIGTACTTATHTIGLAARMIAYGDADIMIAGGAEAPISPLGVGGFNACRALSTRNDDPEKASRPWDKGRDGFVLGEGAAAIVLESLESAQNRGVKILAELVGFGMSSDAYHITSPSEDGEGAYLAMQNAINDAGISIKDIGYINAHGTSTPVGDVIEIRAIERLMSTLSDREKVDTIANLAISSSKSMTGHLLGAAGAIEAVYSILSLINQEISPTINLDDQEPESHWNLVPKIPLKKDFSFSMSNSFGFGGTNGSLLFKKV